MMQLRRDKDIYLNGFPVEAVKGVILIKWRPQYNLGEEMQVVNLLLPVFRPGVVSVEAAFSAMFWSMHVIRGKNHD